MLKKAFIIIGLSFCTWLISCTSASAGSFNVNIDITYAIDDLTEVKVTEEHSIENMSSGQVISKTNKEEFIIDNITKSLDDLKRTVGTASLTVDDKKTDFRVEYEKDKAKITVPYPAEVRQGQKMVFKLVYTSYSIIKKSGAVYDFIAPGLTKDEKQNNDTSLSYDVFLKLRNNLLKTNFVAPGYTAKSAQVDYEIYTFTKENLIDNNIWVQFGTTQYYEFAYRLNSEATDDRNLGLVNTYKIVVPRDISGTGISQRVFFKSIIPEPSQAETDEYGNLFLLFSENSDKSLSVSIEGYIQISELRTNISADNSGNLDNYSGIDISKFIQPADYWEVNDGQITELAGQLKTGETNAYKVVLKTYEYLVSRINYNTVKKFGLNPRQGALLTLEKGSGVCMEYSDLFITLSRAQGIPARAAFGYGYDPLENDSLKEPHQWAEVLLPSFREWVPVDITWGLSGKTLIGGDLNHIYTHVSVNGPEEIVNISRVSYGQNQALDLPQIHFYPMEAPDNKVNYKTQQNIIDEYKNFKNKGFFEDFAYQISLLANGFDNLDGISKVMIITGVVIVFVPLIFMIVQRISLNSKAHRKTNRY